MIKILFYCHQIDYSGTWRSHERTFEALDRDTFDPYIFYWKDGEHNRLETLKKKVPNSRLIPFERSKEKLGHYEGYRPVSTNFAEKVKEIGFDIILFTRSGYFEWPFDQRLAPLQVEISVFDAVDNSPYLDRSIAISHKVNERKGYKSDCVIYYPIPKPNLAYGGLRNTLQIPSNHIVLGRIGRPTEFSPIALEAFKRLQPIDATYLIVAPAPEAVQYVSQNEIPNVIFLPATNDDHWIGQFHNSIDIFAHYREGGESFGAALAESMSYGNPVVSHYSGFNAQEEIIADGGYVVNTVDEYAQCLKILIDDYDVWEDISNKAAKRAKDFRQKKIVKKIEKKLIDWYCLRMLEKKV